MARCKFWSVYSYLAAAVLSVLVLPRPAYGQATTLGNITGTVTDAQSAAVPGAKVTVVNTGTQVSRDTKTDNHGNFEVRSLLPGRYRVKVTSTNLKNQVQEIKPDVR